MAMARNRMIKPEFHEDEKMATISRDARLAYIAMWNFSDDYGAIKGNPSLLKSKIFPYDDDIDSEKFLSWLNELSSLGRIIPYSANNEEYFYLPFFLIHQKINRPSKTRNPEPPHGFEALVAEFSMNNPGMLNDCSMSTHRTIIDEGKGSISIKEVLPGPDKYKARWGDYFDQLEDKIKTLDSLEGGPEDFVPLKLLNFLVKNGFHLGAVDEVLGELIKYWPKDNPISYCLKILKRTNGNWMEKDHITQHKTIKQANQEAIEDPRLKDLLNGIG